MRASLLILITLAICASHAQARIYTCKDKDGNTVYSDTPSSEACIDVEEVKVDTLPDLIGTKPLAVPSSSSNANASKQDDKSVYKSLAITSPSADENLRDNQGKVQIAFQASPALNTRQGHQYVVMLSGKEVYKGSKSSVALENVDRGSYAVTAKVIAQDGKTLISSAAVQFTLQRFSRLENQNNNSSFPSNTRAPRAP